MTSPIPAAPVPVPAPKAIRDLFAELLDREVEVAPGQPVVPQPRQPAALAVYVDDHLHTEAVAVASLSLAAHAGAALGLVPPGTSSEAVEAGDLPDLLAENFAEVLNIMASLFNADGRPHLKLWSWYRPGELAPADVTVLTRSVGRRLDLALRIADYGDGGLSIVVAR